MVERNDPLIVLVGEFEFEVEHPDLGSIEKGTTSHEYFWLDRWYNVFRFHEPNGAFRNFYCNINMPPKVENGILDYVDLDIDVLVRPDFSTVTLDLDEFELNSAKFNYPGNVRRSALDALAEIETMIAKRRFPFDTVPTQCSV